MIFTKNGERTGDSIYVQVKSGASYKRKRDHFIPTGNHADFWKNSNAPVYGIVYDPDTTSLYWTNITRYIKDITEVPSRVPVSTAFVLSDETINRFVTDAVDYIAVTGSLHKAFSSFFSIETGVLSNSDYLAYFENEHGERMLFQRKVGSESAILYHGDDLIPKPIVVHAEGLTAHKNRYNVGDWILDREEFVWLVACMEASRRRTGRMKL